MENRFRIDYPDSESSQSEQMTKLDIASEEFEEMSDSSSVTSSNENDSDSCTDSTGNGESSESDGSTSENDSDTSSESFDEIEKDEQVPSDVDMDDALYVQSIRVDIHDEKYGNGGTCAKLLLPIHSIEAVVATPDNEGQFNPDDEGEFCYNILLKSGKELTTFCKCPPSVFHAYLFDYNRYTRTYAKKYGIDPFC